MEIVAFVIIIFQFFIDKHMALVKLKKHQKWWFIINGS